MSELELSVTKVVPASAKTVFEAWLDPESLARFMKPGEGMDNARVDVDPKVGGEFLIVMKAGEKEIPHSGTYKVIDRYKQLSFTWISDFTQPGSTVTIDFEELGPKETKLTLRHTGFPSKDSRDSHEGGWSEIIDMMTSAIS